MRQPPLSHPPVNGSAHPGYGNPGKHDGKLRDGGFSDFKVVVNDIVSVVIAVGQAARGFNNYGMPGAGGGFSIVGEKAFTCIQSTATAEGVGLLLDSCSIIVAYLIGAVGKSLPLHIDMIGAPAKAIALAGMTLIAV